MCNIEKDNIFGVKEAPNFRTDGLELRYEVECGQEGDPDYLRERVYRDEDGNYFMAVKGGMDATFGFETAYHLDGREVLFSTAAKALAFWAEFGLYGEECERALNEFKIPEPGRHKTIWEYQQGVSACQQGYVYELLLKTPDNAYALLSTDASYPCFGCNMTFVECDKGGARRDDLNFYYITPETARRWAEARGMGETDCQRVFGS